MPLFRKNGTAVEYARKLRKNRDLRKFRVNERSTGRNVSRIIIGIGQMHPVLQGKFDRFQAKRIGKCQAEVFGLCRFLHEDWSVPSFGQEGFSSETGEVLRARVGEKLLSDFRKIIGKLGDEELFLKKVALEWRKALKQGDRKKAEQTSAALNALTLMQALYPKVTVFPIEQKQVHEAIGENITKLRQEIDRVEASTAFISVQRKGGKKLTQEEYDAAILRNKLIKEFNKMLAHPERDRAIFREVLDHAEEVPVTVFVLGEAHRSAMLRLARRHVPEDVLFLWITPPVLWWWRAIIKRTGWVLAGIITASALISIYF